ncbi:MAG: DUF624 domain-containing protein [Clostridia bacterium]|nr:DUF624 domain-containing protein [Clostridia bacterium]
MAGFFGLFNYEKEGPGIDKDAPKKKTFIVFLEMFKINFWKFIPINLVFILLNLPVLTGGLASAGMTHVVRNTARDKHSFGMSDFFETIKKNWKQSLIAGIVNVLILALAFYAARFYGAAYGNTHGTVWLIGFSVTLSLLMVFTFAKFYIWTMIITFDLPLFTIYKNGIRFAFINLLRNALVGILMLLTYAFYGVLIYILPGPFKIIIILLMVCTLPAYRYLMIQFVAFPAIKKYMIDPYYEEHPDMDIEKRKSLGLLDE